MALLIYWYDFICFGIVVGAYIGSLWVLWRKEFAARRDNNTIHDSLLVDGGLPRNHVGSSQLWTTCWKSVSPLWLLLTRFISFVIMAALLTLDIINWGPSVYIYYTEWTFTLVMVYFALATVISTYGCWISTSKVSYENGTMNGDREKGGTLNSIIYRAKEIRGVIKMQSHHAEEAVRHRAGFWGYLMQTVYQTSAGAVILTDLVFWGIIVPFGSNAHLHLNLLMGCMHSLNAVLLLIDTALNNLPFPWFRIAYFVQWSCVYVVFQWVIHACGLTWWPYPFLELDLTWAPLWYFVLAVVHIPCYGFYALLVNAKHSIFPKLCPCCYVRSY